MDLGRGRESVGGLLGPLRLRRQRRRLRRAGLATLARPAPIPGRGVGALAAAPRPGVAERPVLDAQLYRVTMW